MAMRALRTNSSTAARSGDTVSWRMADTLLMVRSLPLVDRHVGPGLGPGVQSQRPDQDVILELLQHLHGPARHAADGEDWYEQIARNAEQVIDHARIEIDINVHAVAR